MAFKEALQAMLPKATAALEGIQKLISPATAATATTDGAIGTVVLAADNDTSSRNKAATPAAIGARVAAIPNAGASTASVDGTPAGLAIYARDSDLTSRNKAVTPAGMATQLLAAATPDGGAATATVAGTRGTQVLAPDNAADTVRNQAATPALVAAKVAAAKKPTDPIAWCLVEENGTVVAQVGFTGNGVFVGSNILELTLAANVANTARAVVKVSLWKITAASTQPGVTWTGTWPAANKVRVFGYFSGVGNVTAPMFVEVIQLP